MCKKILVFAGTYEGHRLAAEFAERGWTDRADFCVATEYGTETYDDVPGLSLKEGRLTAEDMENLMGNGDYGLVIDATHPYARVVTDNIKAAGGAAGIPCLRLLRKETFFDREQVTAVDSIEEAVEILQQHPEERILLTTGSKELHKFRPVSDRAAARVLPSHESLELCEAAGFAPKNICAMQGPFTRDMNLAMMKQYNCRWLVTKNTGKPGGFDDKVSCAEAGYSVLVIGRPAEEEGLSYEEVLKKVEAYYGE